MIRKFALVTFSPIDYLGGSFVTFRRIDLSTFCTVFIGIGGVCVCVCVYAKQLKIERCCFEIKSNKVREM